MAKVKAVEKQKNLNQIVNVNVVSIESEKKEQFLINYKKCVGLKWLALDRVGLSADELYRWTVEDPEFEHKFTEVENYAADVVESKLLSKIDAGDTQAIIFYCETKLRNRGYYKKQ